jgi:hypothetical protein
MAVAFLPVAQEFEGLGHFVETRIDQSRIRHREGSWGHPGKGRDGKRL